jgi:uncharacterized protein YukE
MKKVDANIDEMRQFSVFLKHYKQDVQSRRQLITLRLSQLSNSWRDKAYETYKEEFLKEWNRIVKADDEFLDEKIKEIELKASELEEFLNKFNR